ncbi:MAG TPA: ADP-ribosylglycohydrolase family protein [Fimbriimonas sp.]|nr:ADP-ribosylglycohydrolase family protein [Fimbriimonas sp.]
MDDATSNQLYESLLGTGIGDSLGLPYEGLSAKRAPRLLKGDIRPRLWFGKSFVSDDTLQTIFVLQSLHACNGEVSVFQKELSRRLRSWFWAIPPGIGKSTIVACLKITFGMPPSRSGVNSAGNGAAMRSAIIGHWFADDRVSRIKFTEACARVTHANPAAISGAQIAALAAALAARGELRNLEDHVRAEFPEWPLEYPRPERGPSGYVLHTINAVVDVCSKRLSFHESVEQSIRLGGDTDSVAAIVGGILGTSDATLYRTIASPDLVLLQAIASGEALKIPYWQMLMWHLCQIPIVLTFGLRRILPPY